MNIPLPDNKSLEILAQVVYKEMCADLRETPKERGEDFWGEHKEETLALSRNIIKIIQTIDNVRPKS